MNQRTSTAAPADWTRGVSGTFTLDGEAVDLDRLAPRTPLSSEDAAAIARLPVGGLFELDADIPGAEALLRRTA